MQFSVIYSVDIPRGVNMRRYVPPKCKQLWDETENNYEGDGYSYLEGRWTKGVHRKWCALLDEKDFEEFVESVGIFAEPVETMGSIGAPGYGFGWAPAISFRSDSEDAIQSAYVTPSGTKEELVAWLTENDKPVPGILTDDDNQELLPEVAKEVRQGEGEKVWELLREITLELYGS